MVYEFSYELFNLSLWVFNSTISVFKMNICFFNNGMYIDGNIMLNMVSKIIIPMAHMSYFVSFLFVVVRTTSLCWILLTSILK